MGLSAIDQAIYVGPGNDLSRFRACCGSDERIKVSSSKVRTPPENSKEVCHE